MKKIIVALMCMAACVCFMACSPQKERVVPEKIDGKENYVGHHVTAAYGELPDVPVTVDGIAEDDFWKDKQFVTSENEYAKAFFTAVPTEKGVLVCGYSSDKTVVWSGRNYFTDNTHFAIKISGAKKKYSLQCDSRNIRPMMMCVNARSAYSGELNVVGRGGGMSFEMFVTWDELGFSSPQKTVNVCASYAYAVAYKIPLRQLYLTGGNDVYTTFPAIKE